MVTTFTYKPSLVHAISSYRVTDPPTHKHTSTHTHRQDRLQYNAPQGIRNKLPTILFLLLTEQQ